MPASSTSKLAIRNWTASVGCRKTGRAGVRSAASTLARAAVARLADEPCICRGLADDSRRPWHVDNGPSERGTSDLSLKQVLGIGCWVRVCLAQRTCQDPKPSTKHALDEGAYTTHGWKLS